MAMSGNLRRSVPLLGAFVVGAIAYAPLYCFPLLAPEFEKAFGTSRELGQMPWTSFLLVSAFCSPFLGRAYDLIEDRVLLLVGALLMVAGWFVAAAAPSVGLLILAYGALLAVGLQMIFVGISTAIARRYAGAAGLALGMAYAGPGIGVAVALPLAAGVIPALGWRESLAVFGALTFVALPFVWLMTSGPAVVVPAAAASGPVLHEPSAPGSIGASQETYPHGAHLTGSALRRTLQSRRFLVLLIGAVAIGCIDEGVFQVSARHAVTRGIDEGFAATMLALQCYAYVVGQIVGGGLSDRFGRRFIGVGCAALMAIGASGVFLATGDMLWLAVAGNCVYGFGIGATIAIRSATFSDVFGGASLGAIFGVVAVAYPMGGVFVMNAGGLGYDHFGNYWLVYGIVLVAALWWSTALLSAGPRRHGLRSRLGSARARLPI
jgi:OFA family oxalate/formate antiporter-like MFS transporter